MKHISSTNHVVFLGMFISEKGSREGDLEKNVPEEVLKDSGYTRKEKRLPFFRMTIEKTDLRNRTIGCI